MTYDLLVIGGSPAGQEGAIAAAELNKRVAIIERRTKTNGGVCRHRGTVGSQTMREAILHLSGYRRQEVSGNRYRQRRQITMGDLRRKVADVTRSEFDVALDRLEGDSIDIYHGEARFLGPHQVEVQQPVGSIVLEAEKILIGCGTTPMRPAHIPFDGKHIFDIDDILALERIPRSLVVVGGSVVGIECAIMFATLGVQVTVVDGCERLLDFCDREIIDRLLCHARSLGMVFRLGEEVIAVDHLGQGMVVVLFESGKRLIGENVLLSVGRLGDTKKLNLLAAGLEPDERGRLWCNETHQTWIPHIYGVGDVVGFPSPAGVSIDQGRQAVCHAFAQPVQALGQLPYTLFTIPQVSMVGKNEQQLLSDRTAYEVGVSRLAEIPQGHTFGDQTGMLKLLSDPQTRKLLGVHAVGERAAEIVSMGQQAMAADATIDTFRESVLNQPAIPECCKLAAADGLNKLRSDRLIGAGNVAESA